MITGWSGQADARPRLPKPMKSKAASVWVVYHFGMMTLKPAGDPKAGKSYATPG